MVRIEVARGLANASVVFRVMAINSSHVKGGGVARRRQCIRSLERCPEICHATRSWNGVTVRNSTDRSPQVQTSGDSMFYQSTRHGNNSLASVGQITLVTK
ncbi:hypothetical protein AVEN_56460-1 [Araneus ventricosus]|uniref:Uncharacterized protein n=1 Tax=Araneus ventricosus TaxID=182803 RepID=A0A4Y2VER6_ARAVE|nr:hypothetical protein AVEN_56460-1 [Araneus ventricosus]